MGDDVFEPVVAAAKVEVEIVGPNRDGIGIRKGPAVADIAVDDNKVGFIRQGEPVLIAVNLIKFLALAADPWNEMFKAFMIGNTEMLRFSGKELESPSVEFCRPKRERHEYNGRQQAGEMDFTTHGSPVI